MKKLVSTLLSLAMVFGLASCGNQPQPEASKGSEETPVQSQAQTLDWPKKPITIICPYSAGGGSDLMSRAVADELAERLGVSVVVEDNPGGSGSVGMQLCSIAKPDGYTIILTAMGACCLSPWTNDVSYTDESFAPICQVSDAVTVICVNKDSGITSFDQMVEMAKATPGSVTYGTSGAGGAHHIAVSALGLAVNDDANLFQHVAYGGGAEAVTALLGNHITATASIYAEPSAYIESGDFLPLLVIGDTTPDYLEGVPNSKELGYDCSGGTWYAFAAPAGTDQAIIDLLETEILDIMAQPEMVETFENLGNPVVLLSQEDISVKWSKGYTDAETTLKAIGMIQ